MILAEPGIVFKNSPPTAANEADPPLNGPWTGYPALAFQASGFCHAQPPLLELAEEPPVAPVVGDLANEDQISFDVEP